MTLAEKAYMAGLFDGEGTIIICKDKRGYYGVSVAIVLTDHSAICKIAALTDTGFIVHPTRYDKNRKDAWRWQLKNRKAIAFLKTVLPYLIVKRRQAETAIKFQHTVRHGGFVSRPYTVEEMRVKELLYWQLRMLNNHRNLAIVPEPFRACFLPS